MAAQKCKKKKADFFCVSECLLPRVPSSQGKPGKSGKKRENLENSGNFVWKSEAPGKTQGILFWNKIHFYFDRIFCMPTCCYRFTSFRLTKDMK